MAIPPKTSPLGRLSTGLASRVTRLLGSGQPAAAPGPWLPHNAPYPRVLGLDAEAIGLMRLPGLYACWHLGVRPRWVRVGAAADLGGAILRLRTHSAVAHTDANGGLFIAWALLPVERLPGTVGFLAEHLKPLFQSLVLEGEILPLSAAQLSTEVLFPLPPGTQHHAPPTGYASPV